MNDLETIENYVTGQLSDPERSRFETTLRTDPALADALAFYVLAKHTAKVDAHDARVQRLAELDALRRTLTTPQPMADVRAPTRSRPLWSAPMRWAAAASVVLLLGVGWLFFRPTDATSTLAASRLVDEYAAKNFAQLPVTMDGGVADSLQQGIRLFNEGKLPEAGVMFQDVLTRRSDNDTALKYAGIVAFRQGNYDQAIDRFHRLSQRTDLFSNPGPFYEAIAILKRNRPMDKEQAKKLLEDVINRNLEGKADAQQLINQL